MTAAVEADHETVREQAVSALRAALVSGMGVADAFRRCWYRHPVFATALFVESACQRFGTHPDIRAITSFVAAIRESRRGAGLGFPCREAEALIRAALGEAELMDAVHPGQFSYPEIGIAVLVMLYDEMGFSTTEWEPLLERASATLEKAHCYSQELSSSEGEWFALGMPDSPFVLQSNVNI